MAKSVINVLITGDNKDFRRAIDDTDSRLQRFGDSGRRTLATLGTAVAGFGVAAVGLGFAFKPLVDSAADQGEALNKASVIFDESASTIEEWSRTTADAFGISRTAALETSASFGQMATAAGLSGGDLADFGMTMTEVAADVASFNNITTDEAITKLMSGLAGETEPLRRLGIFFNAATVEAKAFELGLADANGEIDDGAKILARQALIMEQLGNQGALGDFARTSDDLANAQRRLSAQFADVQAELGQALLPIALEVVQALNGMIEGARSLAAIIGEEGVGGAVQRLWEWFNELNPAVQAAAYVVGGVLVVAFGAWAVAAGAAAVATLAAIAPVLAIGAAIGLLVFGLIQAWEHSETFRDIVTGVWEAVQRVVDVAWNDVIRPIFESYIRVAQGVIDFFAGIFTGDWGRVWDGVKNIVGGFADYFRLFLVELPGKVLGWLADLGVALFNWFRNDAKDAILSGLGQAVAFVALWFIYDLPNIITGAFFGTLQAFVNIGKRIVEGIWEGIKSLEGWILDKVGSFVGNLVDSAAGFLGIGSPSKVFMELGEWSGIGYVEGLEQSLVLGGVANSFVPSMSPAGAGVGPMRVQVVMPDGQVLADVVADAQLDRGAT